MDRRFLFCQRPRYSSVLVFPLAAMINRRRGNSPEAIPPVVFSLSQNYPNPFNPETEIRYQIAEVSAVSLRVFNMLGQEVATLEDRVLTPGNYRVRWDVKALASGIHVHRLHVRPTTESREATLTRKLVILR